MTIIATAPTRIDLAGGTLDLEPLYLFHRNASSINVAITIPATVELEPRAGKSITIRSVDQNCTVHATNCHSLKTKDLPLVTAVVRHFAPAKGFRLTTNSSAPTGSGLGASSSLMVALTAAFMKFTRQPLNLERLLHTAKAIETAVIQVPTGYQDYLAAIHGGVTNWHFGASGIVREPLKLKPKFIKSLEEHLVLAYTGVPHFSGINNWQIFKSHVDGNRRMYRLFEELRDNALTMTKALKAQSFKALAQALQKDWVTRQKLAASVSTKPIDRLMREGRKHGLAAARVCGAGGGGCVALLAQPGQAVRLKTWLNRRRAIILPYRIDPKGLRVSTT